MPEIPSELLALAAVRDRVRVALDRNSAIARKIISSKQAVLQR